MSSEGARSGVKRPGPRARVACEPTPATQTILYYGLGFLSFDGVVVAPNLKRLLQTKARGSFSLFSRFRSSGAPKNLNFNKTQNSVFMK